MYESTRVDHLQARAVHPGPVGATGDGSLQLLADGPVISGGFPFSRRAGAQARAVNECLFRFANVFEEVFEGTLWRSFPEMKRLPVVGASWRDPPLPSP